MDLQEFGRQKPKNTQRHPWELVRARITRFLIARKKSGYQHVIDIGAGDAFVLANLSETRISTRFSAIDQEYNTELISRFEGEYPNLDFYKNVHDAVFQESQRPDLVLLMDVLEHVKDEQALLTEVLNNKVTAPHATILITVPAFQSLFSTHDRDLGHHRRYSLKQLRAICQESSLEVTHCGYFFSTLLPVRFLQKLFPPSEKKSIENWAGSSLKSRLIQNVLWIDFRICFALSSIGIHLPGLSCYCLCRKSQS